jgi:transcriptional regulator with XRE-family HTH domain
MDLGVTVGKKIKKLRKERGYSLRRVGEQLGIDYSYLAKIEKGQKPSIKLLEQIASFFDVDIKYFLGDLTDEETSFLQDLHLTPEQLAEKYDLVIDGEKATKEEIRIAIETIRVLRNTYKKEG